MVEYYDGRHELASYTVDTELRRMRYSVVTKDGERFGDEEEDRVRDFLSGRKEHPMLCMANQSIFAEMLEARICRVFFPNEIALLANRAGMCSRGCVACC